MPPFVPRKRHASPSPSSSAPPAKRAATPRTNALEHRTKHATPAKQSVFEALDASTSRRTVEDSKAFLNALGESDSESGSEDGSGSSDDSDEFEDVLPASTRKPGEVRDDSSDEEEETWEDALPAAHIHHALHTPAAEPMGDLEITLNRDDMDVAANREAVLGKRQGPSKQEKRIRIATHCMHVQFLLFHNLIRNSWTCDKEVQSILVKGLSEGVKKEVERYRRAAGLPLEGDDEVQITRVKKKVKGKGKKADYRNQRDWGAEAEEMETEVPNMSGGDPLIRLLKYLAAYWKKRFKTTAPGLRKQGYRSAARLREELDQWNNEGVDVEAHGERIADLKQFRECAQKCEGSRDVGAQLFTALLRGLGLSARLLASLQPVGFGWSKSEEALPKKSSKTSHSKHHDPKNPQTTQTNPEPGRIPAIKSSKAPIRNSAGKTRSTATNTTMNLDTASSDELSSVPSDIDDDVSVADITPRKSTPSKNSPKRFDKDLPFPFYWTEVLSPTSNTYIPVDALVLSTVASNPDLLYTFEPRGAAADKAKQVIAYVIAYSADGTAKDVTVRYLRKRIFPGKTKGVRMPAEKIPIYDRKGKVVRYEEQDWFKSVILGYARPSSKRTLADQAEDEGDLVPALSAKKATEEFVDTLTGLKASADYVLERHLRREEALLPSALPVRHFTTGKGDAAKTEPVYRRADVVACKTTESWHKEGRQVIPGSQPMKLVPMRAVTLQRKREIEEQQREAGGEKVKQGLFAQSQTEWIIPPPIEDGRIPRNAFGNIDVYVPTMVPRGAVHVPLKSTAKLCRRLDIDYAEACVGFEFGKQRAVPVLLGVVVAVEHEDALIDAWEAEEEEKRRKEDIKREARALAMWRKFMMGTRIVQRMREDYAIDENAAVPDNINPFTNRKSRATKISNGDLEKHAAHHDGGGFVWPEEVESGGFIRNGDEETSGGGFIVEQYHHQTAEEPSAIGNGYLNTPISLQAALKDTPQEPTEDSGTDNDMQESDDATSPEPPPAKPATRGRGRPRGRAAKNTAGTSRTSRPSASTRNGAEPKYTSSEDEETLSSAASDISSDEDQPENGDSASERSEKPAKRNRSGISKPSPPPPEPTTNRVVPRRRAARKSETAVRSHYFSHDSEEESPKKTRATGRGRGRGRARGRV
ncbi:hypothetical protein W97_05422 [Coniosporium apollinis CBS 100218]|uniref:Xeroderma pigmentosum group C-complementing protein n=1 Tax=Coniosporium apollinis (strain CBS 100218) TaxID=1168221 RepID=R7YWG4_CONA1|nr:uncharacterized protein W97_05422 [Coniosporium apollinis CBS 100218]EON66178.1 hypothetical protein W97_05422 [Coniosporium apollinis CBS 100218]